MWDLQSMIKPTPCTMILCDVKGNKIDARIPWGEYMSNFKTSLFEGKWYYLQHFRLKRSTTIPKYTDFHYEIEFMWHTKMWAVSDRAEQSSLQFIHADEVNGESEDHVVDVIGVITTVSTVSSFPYCCPEGETDYDARYVTFTIRDNHERIITCVARGSACESFLSKVYRLIGSKTYNYEPLTTVLRFFRTSMFKGSKALISEYGCSRVFIEEEFPDFDVSCYMYVKDIRYW
ncbi:hypothetical protein; 90305-89226 [Arabidopsis thaliana]|uniref:Uncharacterized protein T22A15.14 n=1 Tax=Arabidopsis thaliana TaxID=3702 RepID=Q9C8V5_ARATH|nr:hypothetical protein; 90305-89226 [Arabidopsis thaliana]